MPVKLSIKDPLVAVWATLMALTALSLWMGAGHDVGGMSTKVATVIVLVVAFVKAGAVAAYFMEVARSATVLRVAAAAWVLVIGTSTITLYLAA